jgi:hypothetical protein
LIPTSATLTPFGDLEAYQTAVLLGFKVANSVSGKVRPSSFAVLGKDYSPWTGAGTEEMALDCASFSTRS